MILREMISESLLCAQEALDVAKETESGSHRRACLQDCFGHLGGAELLISYGIRSGIERLTFKKATRDRINILLSAKLVD